MSDSLYHVLLTLLSGGVTCFLIVRLSSTKETDDPKNRRLVLAYFIATLLSMLLTYSLMFTVKP